MKRTKTIRYEHQDKSTWKESYPECSMFRYLKDSALKWENLKAIEFEGRSISYKLLFNKIESVAKSLINLGITNNDIVTIISPNIPQAVISFYALNSIGAIANMLHPMLSNNEMKKYIKNTKSKLIIVLDIFADKVANIEVPKIYMHISDSLPFLKGLFFKTIKEKKISDGLSWKEFLKLGYSESFVEYQGKGSDTAAIMYTGGTSGNSKGVLLTNSNFNALAIQSYDTMGIKNVAGMKCLNILPLFHGTGLGITVHSMLTNGICSILVPKFDSIKTCSLVFKRKTEFIFGVPAFYDALSRCKEIENKSCSFIRVIGSCGDILPEKTRNRINNYLAKSGATCTLTNGYGMTECTAGCIYEPYFKKKPGTSGIMNPDNLCKIVKKGTEEEVPNGKIGELCISGPLLMKGYFDDEENTNKTLKRHSDGILWLHTGDAFSIDEEGYLTFHQRLDRMFIISGFNIYPSDIEEVILKVSGVSQCCVIGRESRIVGKTIIAYIKGDNSLEAEIMKRCKENLPEYSIPSEIIFLNEFPKTKLGKIDYKELERM